MTMPISNLRTRCARALAGAAVLAGPVARAAAAQAPAAADTADVRPGDTLWAIARDRLGSPYRWPDILTLNVGTVADPHWIYPGQRLRLPTQTTLPAADASVVATVPIDVDASAPSTLFALDREATPMRAPAVVPSRGTGSPDTARGSEWFTVPFVAAPGAPHGAGRVVDGVDVGPRGSEGASRRFQRFDRLVVTLPADVAATAGNTVLLVRRGPDLGGGQVLLPTAVAVVERADGGLATVRLTRVYDVVQAGQSVVAVPSLPALSSTPTTRGVDSRVVWIAGSAELPTLYSAIVLAAGSRDDVREGDRFELLTDDRRATAGVVVPGTRAAVARVIRVTEFGATALIVSQEQPAVHAGMRARRIDAVR